MPTGNKTNQNKNLRSWASLARDPKFLARFFSKVRIKHGCWEWIGAKNQTSYGLIEIHPKTCQAHRISYELVKGPIPEGLQLDHLCRNPSCVNPSHLEAVTCMENIRRGMSGRHHSSRHRQPKTHCLRGHEFTPENTYISPTGQKQCIICRRARDVARYQKRKLLNKS
jgi:hypothetical protein